MIDGTTQAQGNYAGTPLIEIDGSQAGGSSDGLTLSAGSSTVRGLAIVNFSGAAIVINASSSANIIEGNYLGVATSGTSAAANQNGIVINGSSANTIGGTVAGDGNLISGNTDNGVVIDTTGGAAASNVIIGNFLGTTASGLSALGNGESGLVIEGATYTQVGMPGATNANVISGNVGPGLVLTSSATGTTVENNEIGVGSDGQTAVSNGSDGIQIDGDSQTQIGGTDPGDGNVISSNRGNGINIESSLTGVLVEGNDIGTDSTATLARGNVQNGINLECSSNTIGGTVEGAANVIDYNGSGQTDSGVQFVGSSPVDNEILSNSIYKNAWLGINLGAGPTDNHTPGTAGPNDYQNYPVLGQAESDGSSINVTGSLYSAANTTYLVQFFASQSPSSSDFGEGQVLIGSSSVTTNSVDDATFSVPLPSAVAAGEFISATATSPSGDTSEFCEDIAVQGEINLVLSGTSTPSPVLAGADLTYTLTVANHGLIFANDVSLTDTLPSSVTLEHASASQGFVLSDTGGSIVASLGSILPGSSATVTIVVQTSSSFLGTLTDQATVTSAGTDPDPSAESLTLNTLAVTSADLAISMSTTQNTVLAGGNLTYSITVSNSGPGAASGVAVTLPLADGVEYVSSNWPTVTNSDGQVVASVGALAVGADASFTLTVSPQIAGQLTETATVSSTSIDPNMNTSSTVTTQVEPAAALAVGVVGSAAKAVTGTDYQYTVTVTNNGPSTATGVVVSDALPQGVSFVSATGYDGVNPVDNNGIVTLSIAELDAAVPASFTIEVSVSAAPGAMLTDTASVTGQQVNPDPTNSTTSIQTPVVGISNLSLLAAGPSGTNYVGQPLTFSLTASNAGPNNEPDAEVTCDLPSDVVFSSATVNPPGSGASVEQGVLTVDIGLLPAGLSATVAIVVVPQAAAAGTLSMSFTIQGDNVDPDSANNTAQASATVAPAADLAIALAPGTAPPCVQSDWDYTLTVTDLGLSGATGLTVLAPLPSDATFVSAQSTVGPAPTLQAGALTADVGSLSANQKAVITVVVEPAATGNMPLSASVSGNQYDPDRANNSASTTVVVDPSANLLVTLAPQGSAPQTGYPFTLLATVANTGPDPASNVSFALPLVSGFLYDSGTASQGTLSVSGSQVAVQVGSLAPGTARPSAWWSRPRHRAPSTRLQVRLPAKTSSIPVTNRQAYRSGLPSLRGSSSSRPAVTPWPTRPARPSWLSIARWARSVRSRSGIKRSPSMPRRESTSFLPPGPCRLPRARPPRRSWCPFSTTFGITMTSM